MLSPGQEIIVEIDGKKNKTSLRGWKTNGSGYFLLDPPEFEGILCEIKIGTKSIIRFEDEGSILGIMGRFTSFLNKTRLWAFTFTDDPIRHTMRSNERYTCLIPASAVNESSAAPLGSGMITDLSLSGLRLVTKKPLDVKKGDFIDVVFSLNPSDGAMTQRIEIARSGKYEKIYTYSGPFIELVIEDEKRLTDFFEFCKQWIEI